MKLLFFRKDWRLFGGKGYVYVVISASGKLRPQAGVKLQNKFEYFDYKKIRDDLKKKLGKSKMDSFLKFKFFFQGQIFITFVPKQN